MYNPLILTIILYSILVFILLFIKPSFLYNEGILKNFGVRDDNNKKTIFPLWIVILLISIVSYVLSFCILNKFDKV